MSKYDYIFGKAPSPFEPTHSSFQQNYALHRAIGDIPGCVPAVDILMTITMEEMVIETSKRADQFIGLLENYATLSAFTNDPLHRTDVTLVLVKNPCKPYVNSYT